MFLEILITELKELINTSKALYYENLSKKLNNLLLQAKTYSSILKTFYNEKKIPLIPPLLVDDKFVTEFRTKDLISYPDIWKRSNIIPVHKKNDKQLVTTGQFLFFYFWKNF